METSDFLRPEGRLQPAWFGDDEPTLYIDAWIDEAVEEFPADPDNSTYLDEVSLQKAWVYYRAFEYLSDKLSFQYQNASVNNKGSFVRRNAQIDYFKEQLARYKSTISISRRTAYVVQQAEDDHDHDSITIV